MKRILSAVLLTWGLFDVLTGLAWIIEPRWLGEHLWPGLSADGGILLRRTGAWWLSMGLAQLAAFAWRTPERLRLAAFVRATDGVADLVWLLACPGFSTMGWITIGASPALCWAVAALCWWEARRGSQG